MSTGGSPGGAVAGVSLAIGAFLLVLAFTCSLCQGYRNSRDNAATHAAAATRAALAARQAPPPAAAAAAGYWDDDDGDEHEHGRALPPRAASPTAAGLPSFTYKPSSALVKHNNDDVTAGGGEGEPACSVCLGAFQAGETVRLLPVCLHLFHVQCIDPWLDAHSTCPICRSATDPPEDGAGFLLPV